MLLVDGRLCTSSLSPSSSSPSEYHVSRSMLLSIKVRRFVKVLDLLVKVKGNVR